MHKIIKLLLYVTTLFFIVNATSQNLKRKGGLGVSLYNTIPDSLKNKYDYQSGAFIMQVGPNTTAQLAGLLPNDIITKVNETPISNATDLINFAKKIRANDEVTFYFIRNKSNLTLNAKVVPKPMEQSNTMDIVYGEFQYKTGWVRTILKSPKGKKPKAHIYFLQGLPCYSLDNMQPLDKTKQAIDKMVELGYAVYFMEKGDMGDNQNCPPCLTMGFNEELAMYDAGYQNLLNLSSVNKDKIVLFGHSMGGTTAPLLAAKYQPKGIVVYGTGFKPWSEYLVEAFLIQPAYRGADLGDLRATIEKFKPYIYQFFYTDRSVDEISKEPMGMAMLNNLLGYIGNSQTKFTRHISTFKELNQHNVAKALSEYNNYTLAIYGECDLNANNPLDNIAMIEHVNNQRPNHGTFWLAPKSSHSFEEIGTMKEFIELWDNQQAYHQYAANRFNGKIFEYVDEWLNTVLLKETSKNEPKYFVDVSEQLPEPGSKKASMDVKAGDIDYDGDLDIVLANEFQPNSILINDGKGNFTDESEKRLPQIIHDSEDVLIEDFDGDGFVDLIFCSEDDKVHEFYLNNGNGHFKPAQYQFPNSEANAIISEDINKDGKPDVIFGNNGQNQIFINKGKGKFELEENRLPKVEKVTQDLAFLDIDNDGDLDLIEANEDGNQLYENEGKGFFKNITKTHFLANIDMESRKIAFSDVDRDGDKDLFFANVNFRGNKNPQNRLFINNGKGKFTDETTNRLPEDQDHTIDAIFVDIEDDKDLDIVAANVFGGKVKVYLNDGRGNFTLGGDRLLGGKIQVDALGVIQADFDGDKKGDLYFCDRYNPQIDNKDVLLFKIK